MMEFIEIFLFTALLLWGYMTLIWLMSLFLRNTSIVDIFWGAGFVLAGWFYFSNTPWGLLERKLLLMLLVSLWGMRLSWHIFRRNWKKPEDFRYRNWREEAGKNWWWQSYIKVFLLQGFLMWIISAPVLTAQITTQSDRLTGWDLFAVLVWGIGFLFEGLGDYQLSRFLANPENRGKLFSSGLWRYTRHPNYFGDALQWWGFYIFSLAVGGWWTFFSPALMTFLLRYVSGVALLEKTLINKPGYKEYMERTSAFIPWFPRYPKQR